MLVCIRDGQSVYNECLEHFEAQNYPKANNPLALSTCDGKNLENKHLDCFEDRNHYVI